MRKIPCGTRPSAMEKNAGCSQNPVAKQNSKLAGPWMDRHSWHGSNRSALLVFVAMVIVCLFGVTSILANEDEESNWTTDAEAASEIAQQEHRDMLLLFTGSDWCPPCIKLEEQILSQAGFSEKATESFVLVKFDFPQNTPISRELELQNSEWASRFGVEGFPTLVLLDHTQKPYAFTGFRDESPDAYLAHLDELQKARKSRDEFLKKAADATGLDRARFLDEALSAMDPDIVKVYYTGLVEEIGNLDKEDEAGLRTKYFAARDREHRKAVMSNIALVARLGEPNVAIVFIDEALAENKLPTNLLLIAQAAKLRLLRGLDRIEDANRLVDQMIDTPGIEPTARQRLIINKVYYLVSLDKSDDAFQELEKHIKSSPENLLLSIANGELHDSQGQFEQAVKSYDECMMAAAGQPDILAKIVGAKADALVDLNRIDQALAALDTVTNNEGIPGKIRAETLLHRSLILRENGRRRAAILAENKAVEIVDSVAEKAEIQKLVDQFRRKFDSKVNENLVP